RPCGRGLSRHRSMLAHRSRAPRAVPLPPRAIAKVAWTGRSRRGTFTPRAMKKEGDRPQIDASLVEALLGALDARHGEGSTLRADAALARDIGLRLGLS